MIQPALSRVTRKRANVAGVDRRLQQLVLFLVREQLNRLARFGSTQNKMFFQHLSNTHDSMVKRCAPTANISFKNKSMPTGTMLSRTSLLTFYSDVKLDHLVAACRHQCLLHWYLQLWGHVWSVWDHSSRTNPSMRAHLGSCLCLLRTLLFIF